MTSKKSDCDVFISNNLNEIMGKVAEINKIGDDSVGNKENMTSNIPYTGSSIANGTMGFDKDRIGGLDVIYSTQMLNPISSSGLALVQVPDSTVLKSSTYSSTSACTSGVQGTKRKMCDTVAITTDAK